MAADRLAAALATLLELIDHPPERACSCHVSPPCGDCVEHGGLRDAINKAQAALAEHEKPDLGEPTPAPAALADRASAQRDGGGGECPRGWTVRRFKPGIIDCIELKDENGIFRIFSPVSDPWMHGFLAALATPPPSSTAPEAVAWMRYPVRNGVLSHVPEFASDGAFVALPKQRAAGWIPLYLTPAQPAVQGGGSREVVFLVEAKFPDGSTRWLTAKGLHKYRAPEFDHWTTDANSARRFLRRGYAEKVVQEQYLADEHHAFVTEHMWIGGPAEDVDPPGNPANSHPQPAVQPASADLIALAKRLESAMLSSNPEAIGDVMVVANELRTAGNAPAVQGERESIAFDPDELMFEPDENHAVADMANVGYDLMQQIARNRPAYMWNESPAEIVCDLLNEIGDMRAARPAVQGEREVWADALESFWNAAIGAARQAEDSTAIAVAGALAEGFAAIARGLRGGA